MASRFRVVIFSGAEPDRIQRLIQRIHREVPEAQVCGVLCERRGGKPITTRIATFLRNLQDTDFIPYAFWRVWERVCGQAAKAGGAFLRFVHSGGPIPPPRKRAPDCAFLVTTDYHNQDSLRFVRSLHPDLGIVYGTRILKRCLFSLPRLGSINIHKRKLPDYRGGGPVGLWELLDDQSEIGVTVHQVTENLDAGAIVNSSTIPIEPFDNLTSLALKAHVVGNDLLVRSVADFARCGVNARQQVGSGRMFKSPSPHLLRRLEKRISSRRPAFRATGARSHVKMLAKTLLALPGVTVRNWQRRIQGRFPLTILFHHLVADRSHRMGISTEYFLKHVRFLQKYYDVVSLQHAIHLIESNAVKRPTVVLTFDDGYQDNFISLRAVAEETGVPITMFVSSDHISGGGVFKHDVEHGELGFLPLTWAQLGQMQAEGFEIGSHTRTHFDCGSQDDKALENEIRGSKEELETHLGRHIEFFSFPFGLPENMSSKAAEIAVRAYRYIFSAFGGDNMAHPGGVVRHLRRWSHPRRLWDLELQLQGVLELQHVRENWFSPTEEKSPENKHNDAGAKNDRDLSASGLGQVQH